MSPRRDWLTFERHGGSAPPDDEALSLAEDGSFTARRTIGGPSIGAFAGKLPPAEMNRLRKTVDALGDGGDAEVPTPRHGATEVLETGRHTLRIGSNEDAPKPWPALLKRVRAILEDEVLDHPGAAVTLVADEHGARLEHAGGKAVDVDLGSLQVRVIHLGADEAVLGRWSGRPAGALVDNGETMVAKPRWVTAEPGWREDLPFDHGFRLSGDAWLQVWVDVPIRADGERRAGRLYVPVIPDA
jgi:hypothetical protein